MSRFADFPVYLAMLALLGMLAFSAAKQLAPDPGDLNHTSCNVVLMYELARVSLSEAVRSSAQSSSALTRSLRITNWTMGSAMNSLMDASP